MILPQETIAQVMDEVIVKFLIPKFESLGMHTTGDWEAALESRTSTNRGEIWGAHYTKWLVDGRGPNKDQSPEKLRAFAYYYGTTVIKDWADAKGIDINPIAIAYALGRDGNEIYKQGGTDLLEVLETEEVKNYILSRVGGFIIEDMKTAFVKSAKQILSNGN